MSKFISVGATKVIVTAAIITLTILIFTIAILQAKSANAAAQLPSIRACTSSELRTIEIYLLSVVADMEELNVEIETFDLDGMRETAITMHKNWFNDSPDIPYCAQGVHSRLLVDRTVEVLAIMSISLSYGDMEYSEEYGDMLDIATQDLSTYSEILESY